MAISNRESYNMGVSAFRVKRPSGVLVGQSATVGNFTAEINPSTVATMLGASTYASYMRTAGAEGTGSLTLAGSRPLFVDSVIAGGTDTVTAAASSPTVGAVNHVVGTSVDLTVTAAATVTNNYDFYFVATSATMLTVYYTGDANEQIFENVAVSTTATEIGSTGVSIATSATPNFTVNDAAEVSVDAPHGGKHEIRIPQFRTGQYFQLELWSAGGGEDDTSEKITIPRAFLLGVNISKTAKEMPSTELPFTVLSPLDGGDAIIRELITPVTS